MRYVIGTNSLPYGGISYIEELKVVELLDHDGIFMNLIDALNGRELRDNFWLLVFGITRERMKGHAKIVSGS